MKPPDGLQAQRRLRPAAINYQPSSGETGTHGRFAAREGRRKVEKWEILLLRVVFALFFALRRFELKASLWFAPFKTRLLLQTLQM